MADTWGGLLAWGSVGLGFILRSPGHRSVTCSTNYGDRDDEQGTEGKRRDARRYPRTVTVWDDCGDEVRLRPQLQRLIGLLLSTDGPISIDQISEYVASGQRSGSAARTAAGRLRSVVGDRLVTVGSSYELVLEPDELDATIFQSLRERAAGARSNERVDLLLVRTRMLARSGVWRPRRRGMGCAGCGAPGPTALRRSGGFGEALIDVGKWSDAVTLLEPHLADVPYQERPIALLMRALAGSGRVTDALRRFRQFTVELRNDIGVGPSQSLSALEFDLLSESEPRPDDAGGPGRRRSPSSSNVREPMSSFVGRVDEVKGLVEELGSKRLVTLVGPGGAGKTRLALRVAEESTEEFVDGSWFVDLAQIDEERDVEILAAATLGARVEPGASPTEGVVDHLRDRRVLVIVDNCEHVTRAASSLIREVLSQCPSIGVLATSRERLAVDGEQVHPVVGLDDFEAHALFCERAAQADDRFGVSDDDGLVIERICRRLDGIPLAIELAAARTRSLTPTDLLERLDDRFRLLRSGPSTNDRHGSLSATVQWSYEMLDDDERTAFDRLSVFSGDFDLAAASAIVSSSGNSADVLAILDSLVDKSLLVADRSQRHTRYRLLETLRLYGVERLMERGESEVTRRRHGDHYLSVSQAVRSANDAAAPFCDLSPFVTVHTEWHNFRAAVNWALEDDDPGRAARVALISEVFYLFLEEHATWMDRILARLPDEHPLASICHASSPRVEHACAATTSKRSASGIGGSSSRTGSAGWHTDCCGERSRNRTSTPVLRSRVWRRPGGRCSCWRDRRMTPKSSIRLLSHSRVRWSPSRNRRRASSTELPRPHWSRRPRQHDRCGTRGRCCAWGTTTSTARWSTSVAGGRPLRVPHLQGVALRDLAVAAHGASYRTPPARSVTPSISWFVVDSGRSPGLGRGIGNLLGAEWTGGRCGCAPRLPRPPRLGYGLLVAGHPEVTPRVPDLSGAGEQRATGASMGRDDLMAFALDGLQAGS